MISLSLPLSHSLYLTEPHYVNQATLEFRDPPAFRGPHIKGVCCRLALLNLLCTPPTHAYLAPIVRPCLWNCPRYHVILLFLVCVLTIFH